MKDSYESPLSSRYATKEMQYIFSPYKKFKTWRKLWVALAESEMKLGIPINEEQIEQMRGNIGNINYEKAKVYEHQVKHDVMAHVLAFGDLCPKAKPIIHLGATSCYVGDNTDVLIMHEALTLIREKVIKVIKALCNFAQSYKGLPTLAFTHFQSAQPTTVGKRATLWVQDLLIDLEDIDFRLSKIRLLGCKGTTGTQASFLQLFAGDHEKVKKLEELICSKMGFTGCFAVSGQTYSRKQDSNILFAISAVAQSAAKFSNDLRLLQHLKEAEEPFGSHQVGSSAMAYKRNPILSERIASLSRHVIINCLNPCITASAQWLERSLDDSANKRLSIPEAFLSIDAILEIYLHIAQGMVVYPKVIEKHIKDELPFMATENILMDAVKRGGDRQELHERIRLHCMEASRIYKEEGKPLDLLKRIAADPAFNISPEDLQTLLIPQNYIGRAKEQTEEFLQQVKQLHL